MKNIIEKCFGTTKRTVISVICIVAAIALISSVSVYAAVRTSVIGEESAQNYAFADAGVDPAAAEYVRTEFEYENGQFVYDIEFTADGAEYEYWIKASDGTVVKKEVEIVTTAGNTATVTASITVEEAKEIALADAGLTADEVTMTKAELDVDDNLTVYDVEFYADNVEYEYEINADTGAIYSKSKETKIISDNTTGTTGNTGNTDSNTGSIDSTTGNTDNTTGNTGSTDSNSGSTDTTTGSTNSTTDTTATTITLADAKAIALADAGVTEADVTYTKAKTDKDDGVSVYDIEFYTSTKEYEYEIRVSDGKIVDKSVETFKTSTGTTGNTGNTGTTSSNTGSTDTTGYISLDEAKTIALNKAGLSASDVTFEKTKLEKDDGVMVYEIEFYQGRTEYECTINATTGAVIEYDMDIDD